MWAFGKPGGCRIETSSYQPLSSRLSSLTRLYTFEAVPLLTVEQWPVLCDYTAAIADSCLTGMVTVQLPFDLPPDLSPTSPVAARPSFRQAATGVPRNFSPEDRCR